MTAASRTTTRPLPANRTAQIALRVSTALLVLGLASCGGGRDAPSPIEDRRSAAPSGQPGFSTGTGGIRDYGDYQSAVAVEGETVSQLASRIGLSAAELGAYNGLPPTHVLKRGDELVLPPRPQGAPSTGSELAAASGVQTGSVPGTSGLRGIEQAPITNSPSLVPSPPGTGTLGNAPTPGAATSPGSTWSPSVAEAAIQRATGIDENGNLAAPPSANEPLPSEPQQPGQLQSPNLGQYQTRGAPGADPLASQPPEARPNAGSATTGEQVAALTSPTPRPASPEAATPRPIAPAPTVVPQQTAPQTQPVRTGTQRLVRPVNGPVAVGFRRGSGAARNDGVDFASQPGEPVLAADDGEVALVSESLGGLGTIVLLRHADNLLTVYGRIGSVSLRKGELVSRGQQIGTVATPPSGNEARMHFEVRRGAESLDPLQFVPG